MIVPALLFGQSTRLPSLTISGTKCAIVHKKDTTNLDCLHLMMYENGLDVSLKIRFYKKEDAEFAASLGVFDFDLPVESACYRDQNRLIETCLQDGRLIVIGKGESWSWRWAKIKDGNTTLLLFD